MSNVIIGDSLEEKKSKNIQSHSWNRMMSDEKNNPKNNTLAAELQLAKLVITLRKTAGLNQREFAERLGMKQSQLARIEAGRQIPKLQTISKLAAAAGYKIEVNVIPLAGNSQSLRLDPNS